MRKVIVLITVFLTILSVGTSVQAQALGQDKEGFSSVVVPTTTLNLDLENDVASFTFYGEYWNKDKDGKDIIPNDNVFSDYLKAGNPDDITKADLLAKSLLEAWKKNEGSIKATPKNNSISYGIDLKGGATNGISTLFSGDQLGTTAAVSGLLGINFNHRKYNMEYAGPIARTYLKGGESAANLISKSDEIDAEIKRLFALGVLVESNKSLLEFYNRELDAEAIRKNIATIKKAFDRLRLDRNLKSNKTRVNKVLKQLTKVGKLANEVSQEIGNKKDGQDHSEIDQIIFKKYAEYLKVINEDPLKTVLGSLSLTISDINNPEDWQAAEFEIGKMYQEQQDLLDGFLVADDDTHVYQTLFGLYDEFDDISKVRSNFGIERVRLENASYVNKTNLIYARFGFSGAGFKYDLANDSTTVDTRFENVTYNGYQLELGYTTRFKDLNFLGFSLGMRYTSNMADLDSGTFTLQKTDTTITDGVFRSSEEIKALSGPFDRFLRYDFNVDYIRFIRLSEKEGEQDLFLGVNPYIRHRIYDRSETRKNNTVLGVGAHAFNGKDNKLTGGLFIQTEDAFGVHAKEDSTFRQRVSFGIIVKFAFTGFSLKED